MPSIFPLAESSFISGDAFHLESDDEVSEAELEAPGVVLTSSSSSTSSPASDHPPADNVRKLPLLGVDVIEEEMEEDKDDLSPCGSPTFLREMFCEAALQAETDHFAAREKGAIEIQRIWRGYAACLVARLLRSHRESMAAHSEIMSRASEQTEAAKIIQAQWRVTQKQKYLLGMSTLIESPLGLFHPASPRTRSRTVKEDQERTDFYSNLEDVDLTVQPWGIHQRWYKLTEGRSFRENLLQAGRRGLYGAGKKRINELARHSLSLRRRTLRERIRRIPSGASLAIQKIQKGGRALYTRTMMYIVWKVNAAARCVQKSWKAYKMAQLSKMHQLSQRCLKEHASARILQRACRAAVSRTHARRRKQIRSLTESILSVEENRFLTQKDLTTVQRLGRGYAARHEISEERITRAVFTHGTILRFCLAKVAKVWVTQRKGLLVESIQRAWRSFSSRRTLWGLRRVRKRGRLLDEEMQLIQDAATQIQSVFRSSRARIIVTEKRAKRKTELAVSDAVERIMFYVVSIQCVFRRCIARKRVKILQTERHDEQQSELMQRLHTLRDVFSVYKKAPTAWVDLKQRGGEESAQNAFIDKKAENFALTNTTAMLSLAGCVYVFLACTKKEIPSLLRKGSEPSSSAKQSPKRTQSMRRATILRRKTVAKTHLAADLTKPSISTPDNISVVSSEYNNTFNVPLMKTTTSFRERLSYCTEGKRRETNENSPQCEPIIQDASSWVKKNSKKFQRKSTIRKKSRSRHTQVLQEVESEETRQSLIRALANPVAEGRPHDIGLWPSGHQTVPREVAWEGPADIAAVGDTVEAVSRMLADAVSDSFQRRYETSAERRRQKNPLPQNGKMVLYAADPSAGGGGGGRGRGGASGSAVKAVRTRASSIVVSNVW